MDYKYNLYQRSAETKREKKRQKAAAKRKGDYILCQLKKGRVAFLLLFGYEIVKKI